MHKDEIESAFNRAGAKPVVREKMGEYELYIADGGFSNPPHLRFQKFGIEPEQFPGGMYAAVWWAGAGERLLIGRPMFFEPTEHSQEARINAARKDARAMFKKHFKVH